MRTQSAIPVPSGHGGTLGWPISLPRGQSIVASAHRTLYTPSGSRHASRTGHATSQLRHVCDAQRSSETNRLMSNSIILLPFIFAFLVFAFRFYFRESAASMANPSFVLAVGT